jgi:hypothetical protein
MIPYLLESATRILRAFGTRASLPVFELERAHIQKKGTRIRPFVADRGFTRDPLCPSMNVSPAELQITGWRLAHAVKKADCLRQMPFTFLQRLGFLLEQFPMLDWRRGNLRLRDGIATAYADFAGTSLAGRIGQGVALLFMENRGYVFVGHYQRPLRRPGPDFVFEQPSSDYSASNRALVEAKGAFVLHARQPDIKGVLREGLKQIKKAKAARVAKSFAIGTFLREQADTSSEPSLVAFVDPDGRGESDSVDDYPDWIIRANYAAWLAAMGFHDAASDLRMRTPRQNPETLGIRVVSLSGIPYGVMVLQFVAEDLEFSNPHFWPWHVSRCLVAGLPMRILRAIERAMDHPDHVLGGSADDGLMSQLPSHEWRDGNLKGSILTDGSLLAMLRAEDVLGADREEVRL